jgi:UDP-perosamine 4-acetyltransferase
MNRQQKPFILLGAGGHAKVVLDILRNWDFRILGVCDPFLYRDSVTNWRGIQVLGDDLYLNTLDPQKIVLANGIGITPSSVIRENVYSDFRRLGFSFPPLIHRTAWVSPDAKIEEGVQIMAGAIIQADVLIGENSIINTGATIDHDSEIGAHTHVAPGATICGNVSVGKSSFIGANCTILEGAVIDAGGFVRANNLHLTARS